MVGSAADDRWRVVAASVAGTGHERRSLPNQDAFAWRACGDWLCAVVADGVGSARRSQWGSRLAADVAVAALVAQLGAALAVVGPTGATLDGRLRDGLKASLAIARSKLEGLARGEGIPLRELACTAIAIVAGPDRVAAAQIGDGAVVVADATGGYRTLIQPQQGEFANETVFLTGQGAIEAIAYGQGAGPISAIAMFSDGLQRLALEMPAGEPFAPFFAPLVQFCRSAHDESAACEQLELFLRSPRVSGRTDDDLTLVLATWAGAIADGTAPASR